MTCVFPSDIAEDYSEVHEQKVAYYWLGHQGQARLQDCYHMHAMCCLMRVDMMRGLHTGLFHVVTCCPCSVEMKSCGTVTPEIPREA